VVEFSGWLAQSITAKIDTLHIRQPALFQLPLVTPSRK
jgi:hypothetical protein